MLKYLQALLSYNSDIQAHLLNSEIRRVVHRNLNAHAGQSKTHLGIGQKGEGKKLADAV